MPTYAYRCTACDHRFDAVQSFSDPALTTCPQCQGALRKEYGSIGVTFNGSGFYRTDSRGSSSSTSAPAAKSESSSSSSTPASTPAATSSAASA